jgi:type II secretory pathway pseudopilin PulG
MRRYWVVVAAIAVVGCKKDKAASPPPAPAKTPLSTAEQDALWKLAPDGTQVGIVISSRAITTVEAGWLAAKQAAATAPELAKNLAKLDAKLIERFGSANVKLADVGLAPGKGAALFKLDGNDEIVIVPVADRDKFLAVTKGTKGTDSDTIDDHTCKTVKGVYACAKPAALLDKLGGAPSVDRMKLLGARGDVEIAGTVPRSADPSGPATDVTFAIAVQLERGTLTARGAVKGVPEMVTRQLRSSGKPPIDGSKAAGFVVANVTPLIANFPVPPLPLPGGITATDLAATIRDPITMTLTPGGFIAQMRVPLSDPAPMQKLVDQCETLPPLQMFGAKLVNGACHVSIPMVQTEVQAKLDGKELRIDSKTGTAAATTVAPTPIARELLDGEWAFAMFGRGTMLAENPLGSLPMPMPADQMPEEAVIGLRMMMSLNELALGVRADGDTVRGLLHFRTWWSNPDDVIAKLAVIDPRDAVQGKAAATAKQIAAAHPQSPFAADYKAGLGGMMAPAAAIGVLAAVAIPAFMDYMKKSKKTEASLMLNVIAKSVKMSATVDGALPKGRAPLSPAASCCKSPDRKCNAPDAWKHPVWQAIDFSLDEPHLFRYSYESDGKTFTARAVGDLDCDDNEITYVLTGTIDAQGVVHTTLVEPQPGVD